MKIRFWAIQQTTTGFFLPQLRRRRGYTWTEPTKGCIPRLFSSKQAASCALGHWLQGGARWTKYEDTWMGAGEWDIATTPLAHRKREDMAIVPVTVRVVSF